MADEEPRLDDEELLVRQNRYLEALEAGLQHDEADVFAINGTDVGVLRKLVKARVAPQLIAEIVL